MLPLSPSLAMLELMFVLVLGVGLELFVSRRLQRAANRPPGAAPGWTARYAPLLRGAVMVAAVLFAYPALYGFRAAPPLSELLLANAGRGALLLTGVVLARLLVPWLPPLCRRPGHVDSVQGMLAVAIVFVGFADYLGAISASAWPGIASVIALGAMSMLLPALAAGLGRDFGARWNSTLAHWLGELTAIMAVAPIVVLYGYLLGMQLSM